MEKFEIVSECIKNRRSSKPAIMNGKKISDEIIQKLLELADWAPTHAMTEPWRFVVYEGESLQKYAQDQADLYKANTLEENFMQGTYEKMVTNCQTISHLVVVYMKRGNNPKINALEEICATSAAIQNLLLGASAAGISALWSTGGMTFSPALKEYFQLNESDAILGQIYLGYTDSEKVGTRTKPLGEKIIWNK